MIGWICLWMRKLTRRGSEDWPKNPDIVRHDSRNALRRSHSGFRGAWEIAVLYGSWSVGPYEPQRLRSRPPGGVQLPRLGNEAHSRLQVEFPVSNPGTSLAGGDKKPFLILMDSWRTVLRRFDDCYSHRESIHSTLLSGKKELATCQTATLPFPPVQRRASMDRRYFKLTDAIVSGSGL
jgi:hypothetical protein